MRRGRVLVLSLLLCLAGLLALASVAAARLAYFTGMQQGGIAAPVDLSTGAVGGRIPVRTEGPPADVAISPDGSTAYVTGASDELVRIDVATDTEEPAVSMSGTPWAVAISPDGKRAYTADMFENAVTSFDLETGAEIGMIPVGQWPAGIAVTPDGSRAYVANAEDGTVSVIDLATEAVIDTISVGAGSAPEGIAVTPDGKSVFVANRLGESVSQIDVATGTVTRTIATSGFHGQEIAIAPDGGHAYVLSLQEGVVPIDLATGTAGAPIPLSSGFAGDIAVAPDGGHAYATFEEGQGAGELLPLDLATNSLGAGFPIGERPEALAIVPNQPPHAAFTAKPESAEAGASVAFDATGSSDPDGAVARYDWEFGDGSSDPNGGPTPTHAYAAPGEYVVTLTTTDNEGCSTRLVFTGQTASCNGSSVARTTRVVKVSAPPAAPIVPEPKPPCVTAAATASSFKPKVRPGHVVPGVRVRIATRQPLRVKLVATLLWSSGGQQRETPLGTQTAEVQHWRRIRLALPPPVRPSLPYGQWVKVRLQLSATPPAGSSACAAETEKTLRVRVVKVFPHAVQHDRPA